MFIIQALVKADDYPHIGRIPDLETLHGHADHPKNLVNYSEYYCRSLLKNYIKIHLYVLSNSWISADWTISMVI